MVGDSLECYHLVSLLKFRIETISDTEEVCTMDVRVSAPKLLSKSRSELDYLDLHTRSGEEFISHGKLT